MSRLATAVRALKLPRRKAHEVWFFDAGGADEWTSEAVPNTVLTEAEVVARDADNILLVAFVDAAPPD